MRLFGAPLPLSFRETEEARRRCAPASLERGGGAMAISPLHTMASLSHPPSLRFGGQARGEGRSALTSLRHSGPRGLKARNDRVSSRKTWPQLFCCMPLDIGFSICNDAASRLAEGAFMRRSCSGAGSGDQQAGPRKPGTGWRGGRSVGFREEAALPWRHAARTGLKADVILRWIKGA